MAQQMVKKDPFSVIGFAFGIMMGLVLGAAITATLSAVLRDARVRQKCEVVTLKEPHLVNCDPVQFKSSGTEWQDCALAPFDSDAEEQCAKRGWTRLTK